MTRHAAVRRHQRPELSGVVNIIESISKRFFFNFLCLKFCVYLQSKLWPQCTCSGVIFLLNYLKICNFIEKESPKGVLQTKFRLSWNILKSWKKVYWKNSVCCPWFKSSASSQRNYWMSRFVSKQPSFTTSRVERNVLMTLSLVSRYRQIAIKAFDSRRSAPSISRRRESTFKSIYDNRVGVSLTMWEVNCGRRKFVILMKSHTLSRWNDLLACIKSQNFSFFFSDYVYRMHICYEVLSASFSFPPHSTIIPRTRNKSRRWNGTLKESQ